MSTKVNKGVSAKTTKSNKSTTTRKRSVSKTQKLQSEVQLLQASNAEITELLAKKKIDLAVSQSKLVTIVQIITERFDGDGINDLELPTGSTRIWWWAVWNSREIMKMITEIVAVLKS